MNLLGFMPPPFLMGYINQHYGCQYSITMIMFMPIITMISLLVDYIYNRIKIKKWNLFLSNY